MQSWASQTSTRHGASPEFCKFYCPPLPRLGKGEPDVEPGGQQVAREAYSFHRRAGSSVSYVNCLQELQEAVQRLYKKAASGSAALRMHSLCILLQLSEQEVYPADGISASRLCRVRGFGASSKRLDAWKSHLTKRTTVSQRTERGLS
jgi:hypothetical protein